MKDVKYYRIALNNKLEVTQLQVKTRLLIVRDEEWEGGGGDRYDYKGIQAGILW